MLVRCDILGNTDERYVREMRRHRNMLLAACDWTQTVDSPLTAEEKQAWAAYRQALRDFPATWTVGPVADFPDAPSGGN